jgi:hypothetical protein
MPEFISSHSIPGRDGDLRGEIALEYLPRRGSAPEDVQIGCSAIKLVDTWSFVAMRTLIEYPARRLCVPVHFMPPNDDATCETLLAGLGDLPNGVTVSADAPSDPDDRNIILPATRIDSAAIGESIGAHLPHTTRSAGTPVRERRMIALALQELVDNALSHAKSPTDAIASIAVEPEQKELQLVVNDLGDGIADRPDAAERLEAGWNSRGNRGGLRSIVTNAERRGFDLSLLISAGTGRLACRSGNPVIVTTDEPHIPGFTVAVTIQL